MNVIFYKFFVNFFREDHDHSQVGVFEFVDSGELFVLIRLEIIHLESGKLRVVEGIHVDFDALVGFVVDVSLFENFL